MFSLVANVIGGSLNSLSLASCSLTASDLSPLYQALKKGFQLYMLKLASNRLENAGVIELVDALLSNKTHPLAVLDVSTNSVSRIILFRSCHIQGKMQHNIPCPTSINWMKLQDGLK